jgi:predicted Zn-ribbon and HTH transcriptional regulator
MLELLGKVDVLAADVAAIDKVLGMFAPDMIPQAIPALQTRPKPDWAMRGEVSRIVMALLREAPEPLSTAQIAVEIHARRGLEGEITRLHLKRVRKCLDRQRARGLLEAAPVCGKLVWGING